MCVLHVLTLPPGTGGAATPQTAHAGADRGRGAGLRRPENPLYRMFTPASLGLGGLFRPDASVRARAGRWMAAPRRRIVEAGRPSTMIGRPPARRRLRGDVDAA